MAAIGPTSAAGSSGRPSGGTGTCRRPSPRPAGRGQLRARALLHVDGPSRMAKMRRPRSAWRRAALLDAVRSKSQRSSREKSSTALRRLAEDDRAQLVEDRAAAAHLESFSMLFFSTGSMSRLASSGSTSISMPSEPPSRGASAWPPPSRTSACRHLTALDHVEARLAHVEDRLGAALVPRVELVEVLCLSLAVSTPRQSWMQRASRFPASAGAS